MLRPLDPFRFVLIAVAGGRINTNCRSSINLARRTASFASSWADAGSV
jgi:hypothetical protein